MRHSPQSGRFIWHASIRMATSLRQRFSEFWASSLLSVFFHPTGDVYVLGTADGAAGVTNPYFPYLGAFQQIVFLLKWRPGERTFSFVIDVTGLVNSNSLMAVDAAENIVVATPNVEGRQFATTPGALESSYGGHQNIYVAKIDSSGTRLVYGTYLSVTPGSKEIYVRQTTIGRCRRRR